MTANNETFILEALQDLAKEVGACTTSIKDLNQRMYNGGGGDIPTLKAEVAAIKVLAQTTESKLNRHRAYVAGYAAGVSGVVSGLVLLIKSFLHGSH